MQNFKMRGPLRVSFGGGGTEIDPFKSQIGGIVVNSTINLFTYVNIIFHRDKCIHIISRDYNQRFKIKIQDLDEIDFTKIPEGAIITIASIKYITQTIKKNIRFDFQIITRSDVPVGTGLGASSSLTVTILAALFELNKIPYDPFQLAEHAFNVERIILSRTGGIQDHYCAAYGGLNYMEFGPGDNLKIEKLKTSNKELEKLSDCLLLIDSGISRKVGSIVSNLGKINTASKKEIFLKIRENAHEFRKVFENSDFDNFGELLEIGWELKKNTSRSVSNEYIDDIYSNLKEEGITGGKLCGAGGGGYMLVNFVPENKAKVIEFCEERLLKNYTVKFTTSGITRLE